jgi:hypothetical protein
VHADGVTQPRGQGGYVQTSGVVAVRAPHSGWVQMEAWPLGLPVVCGGLGAGGVPCAMCAGEDGT